MSYEPIILTDIQKKNKKKTQWANFISTYNKINSTAGEKERTRRWRKWMKYNALLGIEFYRQHKKFVL